MSYDLKFWGAVIVAVIVKVATSESHSFKKVFVTVSASLLIAWVGTDFVIDYLNLDPEKSRALTGAVLALTGESLVRWIIKLSPDDVLDRWQK